MGCLIFAVGEIMDDRLCGICQLLRSRFPRKCTTMQVQ